MSVNNKSNRSLAPVEIARLALSRMAERGLSPTPENYTSQYRVVAGYAAGQEAEVEKLLPGPEMVQELQGILDLVSQSTDELSKCVSRFQADTSHMLAGIDAIQEGHAYACLLQAFTVATLSLRQTVDTSRRELHETRRRLDEVTSELKRIEELARTDPLTGLCNRRAMGELVAREIARARRSTVPFCVAILDIDHFKRINDNYGHAAGDKALMHVVFVVKSGLRETDVICRYGGEEFIVVLPGTAVEGARSVIDRLRVMLEKTPLLLERDKVTVRFSAGVAELRAEEGLDGLLERADQALYEAKRVGIRRHKREHHRNVSPKRAGRNRVVVSTTEMAAV